MADSQLRARPGKSKGKSPRPDSDLDDILQKPPKVQSPLSQLIRVLGCRSLFVVLCLCVLGADNSILARMQVKPMRREILEELRLQ